MDGPYVWGGAKRVERKFQVIVKKSVSVCAGQTNREEEQKEKKNLFKFPPAAEERHPSASVPMGVIDTHMGSDSTAN